MFLMNTKTAGVNI